MNNQYNEPFPLQINVPADSPMQQIVGHLNRQIKLVARALRGAVVFDAGQSGETKTINPAIADVTALTLTDDAEITLKLTDLKRGMTGTVEFLQDGTGGWVPTWVNLVGSSPAIDATADKRTLVQFVHVGEAWIGYVLKSGY